MKLGHNCSSDDTPDTCDNPIESLKDMFVDRVQKSRIDNGQCPAMRPVFHKQHGIVQGIFKVKEDIQKDLKIGLFAGNEYPLWARFSSDTSPASTDYKSTCGLGLKLFNTPTPKIFGEPSDHTFDFIFQNHPVFFVDTAKDMCEFTRAGVINKNYDDYLNSHPKTQKILSEMEHSVGSLLGIDYWAILPFSFGPSQYVKYKLRPLQKAPELNEKPVSPTYLANDLADHLSKKDARFEFCIQLQKTPAHMPLDAATVEWPESESPFIPVAEIIFPVQDIHARGQSEYGENLSMNIWRVTEDHRPHGSIADVRKDVYAASAEQRHNVNGVPNGEPVSPKPIINAPAPKDNVIIRAAIHPGIGVARVGNAENEFFIGPEVTEPPSESSNFYRTPQGTLKRQAARFRIYGYNAAGEVVAELNANNATIEWNVHLANRKADWFHFITAMDIPESAELVVQRRNPDIKSQERDKLIINGGALSISGAESRGSQYAFNGKFKEKTDVYLGELQTDEQGRLLVLAGYGKAESPSGNPPFDRDNPDSFNNASDWYDDIADGPVRASVSIGGKNIPVESAWVITAPPNYAPDIISWRTMNDLLTDVYTHNGWLPIPETTSFTEHVLPQLQRLSSLQWVNKGFAALFGKDCPMDFENPAFIKKMAYLPSSDKPELDAYKQLRHQILNSFRPFHPSTNEPRLWPFIYGDNYGGDLFQDSPNTMLALPSLQQLHLQRWAAGKFINDWNPNAQSPKNIDEVSLSSQPAMLDKAAMHFCLADAFHPGCELTWPMRHPSIYSKPYRIRENTMGEQPYQWGKTLNQQRVLAPDGPLYAQVAGGLTRWMGIPWQGDTAYCRSGYEVEYDLYLPTFWPARVPNTVLTEQDYQIVMDVCRNREERIAAYNRRASWNRFIDKAGNTADVMQAMITSFSKQGIIEARPGIENDPDFPSVIYVENTTFTEAPGLLQAALDTSNLSERATKALQAGWQSEHQLENALRLRRRQKVDE